ncbi:MULTISPECIES: quinone-dependent dihydroorotate dehydrogenase [Acinetobacter]|uniref:Dihydroorotate dehydrogenase (quinone) n=3 Tax=Acinetobacter haemolyticus TaxID=29430 RepID=A0A1L6KS76_ACIHA|nr:MULTISPECIES: quinone-dependent dihydroorotate dehydrogenase [Acinetobacter]APR71920.1 dihydroorotate dehydrogenase (quinone) [Acinetobacter haemolyticus]ATZ68783.1 dihydroorotate dehydrogenase (quinone) [Acinetobacter haemolyticus]AZN69702.1 quinone-dependent dihydroorotate dehydrogenase [Acinetobacter haemolyticus]EFF82271.1 dihydroorotate oxidase [Acinetobacter haemolyticus ATCC 19194]ENW17401.1 dihydroorotate dehydrogenase [Acinetobacter haemolyticus CIP 64.3 = MTCC 9819]
MLYSLARPLLFTLAPERAHEVTLSMLDKAHKLGLMHQKVETKPVTCMGIQFPNPVGLAAGLDKNGAHIDALAALGFGFIEIGTITPRPQAGNPQPRLFRIPEAKAIINRMGFNNEGVDQLVENVKASKFKGILGINIGKNADTPVEDAVSDYLICLEKVYNYASYITVNISSPNTKNLRSLQSGDALTELLQTLKDRQLELSQQYNHYVPLVLKVAPDLTTEDIQFIANQLLSFKIDGLIVTNTTLGREGVENLAHGDEAGGLSGAPVFAKSTECLRQFSKILKGKIPLIGVGGILSGEEAVAKQLAGASLVQVYSGLIYTGPKLVKDCVSAMTV